MKPKTQERHGCCISGRRQVTGTFIDYLYFIINDVILGPPPQNTHPGLHSFSSPLQTVKPLFF